MAEYLTNGNFTSDLSSWTNSGGDVDWEYDATGAAHDGGAAKMTHDTTENTTVRARMYQSFSVTGTSSINTATIDAWVQLTDAALAQNDEVDLSTIQFWVQLYTPAAAFKGVVTQTYNFGDLQSYDLADAVDVKNILQNGGDGTWRIYLIADIDRANVSPAAVAWLVGWFDDVSLDITFEYSDTVTGTL